MPASTYVAKKEIFLTNCYVKAEGSVAPLGNVALCNNSNINELTLGDLLIYLCWHRWYSIADYLVSWLCLVLVTKWLGSGSTKCTNHQC